MENFHVGRTDASRRQSLKVAAELAQVHDMEIALLDTCCNDLLDLPHGLPTALAGEHALGYTYIEAPNAEFAHRFGPDSSKLRSIARGLHERMELVVAQQKNA